MYEMYRSALVGMVVFVAIASAASGQYDGQGLGSLNHGEHEVGQVTGDVQAGGQGMGFQPEEKPASQPAKPRVETPFHLTRDGHDESAKRVLSGKFPGKISAKEVSGETGRFKLLIVGGKRLFVSKAAMKVRGQNFWKTAKKGGLVSRSFVEARNEKNLAEAKAYTYKSIENVQDDWGNALKEVAGRFERGRLAIYLIWGCLLFLLALMAGLALRVSRLPSLAVIGDFVEQTVNKTFEDRASGFATRLDDLERAVELRRAGPSSTPAEGERRVATKDEVTVRLENV